MRGTEVANMITSIRNPISSTMLAIAAVVVLSVFTAAVAQADSVPKTADFSALGGVGYVGPNFPATVPAEFTSAVSDFVIVAGDVVSVEIVTTNELVLGGLLPAPLLSCDSHSSAPCVALTDMLAGAGVTSLHDSSIVLTVSAQTAFALSGTISGTLDGLFLIDTSGATNPNRRGLLVGTSDMTISGIATYACFDMSSFMITALADCISSGAPSFQMFPIFLSVTDTGDFAIGENEELRIKSIEGAISVAVTVDSTGGSPVIISSLISITEAEAEFIKDKGKGND